MGKNLFFQQFSQVTNETLLTKKTANILGYKDNGSLYNEIIKKGKYLFQIKVFESPQAFDSISQKLCQMMSPLIELRDIKLWYNVSNS